jgi:hypothetical protein
MRSSKVSYIILYQTREKTQLRIPESMAVVHPCYNSLREMPMNLDPAVLKQISLFATGFSVAFLAALWLSLIFWASRDIRKRTRDSFMRILAVIVVAILFLPGILIYLILRPARTLEEEYQHSLEEEALLQAIEDAAICPGCNRRIEAAWIACPNCHTLLKKQCQSCGKVIALPWNLCPYCATPVEGARKETSAASTETQLPLDDEFLSHP